MVTGDTATWVELENHHCVVVSAGAVGYNMGFGINTTTGLVGDRARSVVGTNLNYVQDTFAHRFTLSLGRTYVYTTQQGADGASITFGAEGGPAMYGHIVC
jgi:hypothetical protein